MTKFVLALALAIATLAAVPASACHSACNFDPLSGGIGVQN
jgi:hypothetical protein